MINSQEDVASRLGLVVKAGCCKMQVRAASCRELSAGPIVQPSPWSDSEARAASVELCKDNFFWKLRKLMICSPATGPMSRRIALRCDCLREPLALAHAGPWSNYR